jgi:Xaa-Pro aminopeptidase
VDRPGTSGIYEDLVPSVADATSTVLKLRKQKEEDEIDEIRASLRLCSVAYRSAKSTIAPGLTEIDVYNEMYRDVVREAGRPVRFAGDFACGERGIKKGGPPTRRRILPGDLYISISSRRAPSISEILAEPSQSGRQPIGSIARGNS